MSDESALRSLAGLQYIMDSPLHEHGWFHPTAVEIATWAHGEIASLRERLAAAQVRNECPECGLTPGAISTCFCEECVGELKQDLAECRRLLREFTKPARRWSQTEWLVVIADKDFEAAKAAGGGVMDRNTKYGRDQHELICELLNVSPRPDEPGDTAFEAVVRLQQQLDEAEAERDDTRAWIRAYYQQWDVKSPAAADLRKRFHWLVEA